MAETSIVFVTQSTTTTIRFDTVTTATPPTGRVVEGVHFYGTEGRTVVTAVDWVIEEDFGIADLSGAKAIARGVVVGVVGQSGIVTFDDPYEDAPNVIHVGGGASFEQRAKWGTRSEALQGTASGAAPTASAVYPSAQFEAHPDQLKARLLLVENDGSQTRETATFAPPTALSGVGRTGEAVPDIATNPSIDDTFEVPYSGSITADRAGKAQVVIAMEARANGSNWFEIASSPHMTRFGTGGGTYTFEATMVGVKFSMGVGGADGIRMRLKRTTLPSDSSSVSLTLGGSVSWRSGTPRYASMVPEDGDRVVFMVVSGAAGGSSFPLLIW